MEGFSIHKEPIKGKDKSKKSLTNQRLYKEDASLKQVYLLGIMMDCRAESV